MSKQPQRRQRRPLDGGTSAPSFTPAPVRARHDGWTPARQNAFITALAETANVEEACAAVGMSARSAYTLRVRPGADSFRQAWDAALDYGVSRLADAMLGRALNGVATPVFYKGEQIGEKRRYDERLAMFILRARAPDRYGKWRDGMQASRDHPDGAARMFQHTLRALAEDAQADHAGRPRPERPPIRPILLMDDPDEVAAFEEEKARTKRAREQASHLAFLRTLDRQTDAGILPPDLRDDEAGTS